MSTQEITFVVLGVALVLLALLVELEHKIIWKNYQKSYHKHRNKFVDDMLKPNKWVYKLNIYVVWPLILILGVAVVVVNL